MAKRQKSKQTYDYKRLAKDSGSEADEEDIDLFVKNRPARKEIPTVEKEVEEGDTLQSLAIRYHCTIEDLKRLNNIHKENEIFAKRVIKVPHRPFTNALASVHISGNSSPEKLPKPGEELVNPTVLNSKLSSTINNKFNCDRADEVNEIIFNSNIHKLDVITPEPSGDEARCGEEEVLLLPQQRQEDVAEPLIARMNCNGADCDIPLIPLVIFILIGIVAIPLIYVFYIAEHLEEYHHETNITNNKPKDAS